MLINHATSPIQWVTRANTITFTVCSCTSPVSESSSVQHCLSSFDANARCQNASEADDEQDDLTADGRSEVSTAVKFSDVHAESSNVQISPRYAKRCGSQSSKCETTALMPK